jgi:hypothetical protein
MLAFSWLLRHNTVKNTAKHIHFVELASYPYKRTGMGSSEVNGADVASQIWYQLSSTMTGIILDSR